MQVTSSSSQSLSQALPTSVSYSFIIYIVLIFPLRNARCTRKNSQGLGGCLAIQLNAACSLEAITETGIDCTHRLTFLTAPIRNCWNADSVCLQCDTEHSTPRTVFTGCVLLQDKGWGVCTCAILFWWDVHFQSMSKCGRILSVKVKKKMLTQSPVWLLRVV